MQFSTCWRAPSVLIGLAVILAAPAAVGQTNCISRRSGKTVHTSCSPGVTPSGGGFADGFAKGFAETFPASVDAASRGAAAAADSNAAIRAEAARRRADRQATREDRIAACIYSGHSAAECAAFEKEIERAANWDVLRSESQLESVKSRYLELRSEVRDLRRQIKAARSEARCWWRCDPSELEAKARYAALREKHEALMAIYVAAEREWKLQLVAHRKLVAKKASGR